MVASRRRWLRTPAPWPCRPVAEQGDGRRGCGQRPSARGGHGQALASPRAAEPGGAGVWVVSSEMAGPRAVSPLPLQCPPATPTGKAWDAAGGSQPPAPRNPSLCTLRRRGLGGGSGKWEKATPGWLLEAGLAEGGTGTQGRSRAWPRDRKPQTRVCKWRGELMS